MEKALGNFSLALIKVTGSNTSKVGEGVLQLSQAW